tara:strand:+ start:137 stop:607 length:471 start_codon:yes stop_codon:yes gene_type:complete
MISSKIKQAALLFVAGALIGQTDNTPDFPGLGDHNPASHQSDVSILSPDRLDMNHSFSYSMASMGGKSFSYGIYTNSLNYQISDNVTFRSQLNFVQPTFSQFSDQMNGLNGELFYTAHLNYRPLPNLSLSFAISNFPYYSLRRGYTGFSPSLFSPE